MKPFAIPIYLSICMSMYRYISAALHFEPPPPKVFGLQKSPPSPPPSLKPPPEIGFTDMTAQHSPRGLGVQTTRLRQAQPHRLCGLESKLLVIPLVSPLYDPQYNPSKEFLDLAHLLVFGSENWRVKGLGLMKQLPTWKFQYVPYGAMSSDPYALPVGVP